MTIGTIERRHYRPAPVAFSAIQALSLAAAPTFALMALVTGFGGPPDMLCGTMAGMSSLQGMAWMYLLMTTFHLAPWLRLIVGRRAGSEQP